VGDLRSDEKREPTFIGFYVGRGDARFRSDNVRFDAQLAADRVAHTFDLYPGAHTTALWKAHGTAWLRLALRHMSAPR
jgi:enterochelin esterase-like enzyme